MSNNVGTEKTSGGWKGKKKHRPERMLYLKNGAVLWLGCFNTVQFGQQKAETLKGQVPKDRAQAQARTQARAQKNRRKLVESWKKENDRTSFKI